MLGRNGLQIAVCIWVSYVTSCYVTSCSVCPGSSVALGGGGRGGGEGGKGGGWHSISLLFENSILLIKVQGYRGMEVSIFEVLFFLTLLVYTAPHIMVFGAVCVCHIMNLSLL